MTGPLVWRQLHCPRPFEAELAIGALRAVAADQHSPTVVLEARADKSGITYLLGCLAVGMRGVQQRLTSAMPGLRLTDAPGDRPIVQTAGRLLLSTRHRALRSDSPELVVRQLLGALTAAAKTDELLVLQLILGPRRIPLAVSNHSPSSMVQPWYQIAWHGNGGQIDGEKRTALRSKVSDHGFASVVRIGAAAASPARRRNLILGVHSALRTSEAPGLQARFFPEPAHRLNDAAEPRWRWPLRINVIEALVLSGWPIGNDDLPGVAPLHPKQVAPQQLAARGDRVIARAWAPGVTGDLGYSVTDAMRHTWVIGPTGTGKSTLLLNLICQDLEAGRSVVVIEPNDLITDLLARIPDTRRDDIVLLDCTDKEPVGINPLARHGRNPELVADGLLATFQSLYADGGSSALGPRSTDILANCLNVLARHGDSGESSLVMLPLLLTNAGFRRSLTQKVIHDDPIAAAPFWSWFESLSDDARSQVIAPLSNKLRPLLRPHLRAVLGQRQPKFNIRDVVLGAAGHPKVLLVPLQKGVIGPETAELLGALVISDLWLALRERRSQPEHQRRPLMIYVDEVQDYLRLPTDLADALATSRSLRAGWHLSHQYLGQLNSTMRSAFEANARSRVSFQLGSTDARAVASGQGAVAPEDFSGLPAFHIYASLMRDNTVQPWASGRTLPSPKTVSAPADIRLRSRRQYGRTLSEVEADFASLLSSPPTDQATTQVAGRRRRTS